MWTYTSFKTPNGLKVRLNPYFCFKYLEEKNIQFWFLSIEAFDELRGFLSVLSLILTMINHRSPVYSGLTIAIMYLYGYYISQSFWGMALLNMIYGPIYMIYSFLSRFFIQYIAIVVLLIITKEYWLLLSFIVARIVCFFLVTIINITRSKQLLKKYGVYLGDVEITAIKLLQFYSDKSINYEQWIKEYSEFIHNE